MTKLTVVPLLSHGNTQAAIKVRRLGFSHKRREHQEQTMDAPTAKVLIELIDLAAICFMMWLFFK